MENLVKQKRVKFPGSRKDQNQSAGRTDSSWETDIAQAGSKALSWLKRHLDNLQVREDEVSDPRESEFTTAVAATAFAVDTEAEKEAEAERKRKAVRADFEKPRSSKAKSRKDVDGALIGEKARRSGSFRGSSSGSFRRSRSGSFRRSRSQEIMISGDSFKRKPTTLQERMAQDGGPSSARSGAGVTPSPARSRASAAESRVEAWERAQIENIRKRNEKLKSSIDAWENEKKLAARLKMERKKNKLEEMKERNNQHYREKLSRIEIIAGGARNQAEEERRSKEADVRDKAKKMRRSGRVPRVSCFGFHCCYY